MSRENKTSPFQRLGGELFEERDLDGVLVRVARGPGVALLIKRDGTAERFGQRFRSDEALRAVVGDIVDEGPEIRRLLEKGEHAALHARLLGLGLGRNLDDVLV